ncbi:MAG: response regulator transcription factor [Sulfurovum sp.]|jgi:two-component system OmpR family response regulator|nr:MAG: response regulator transcription factor [Sulfurovum sp.]
MTKILMIEDDSEFASLLKAFLVPYNIEVTNYEDPYLGLSCGIEKFDLLILDLTLPSMDGLEVCKEVASKYDIPIIISSARSDLSDKVVALQLGADDYLPKPYDPQEMYARIVSLLRRYKKVHLKDEPKLPLRVDKPKHTIFLHDKALELTPAEFAVLELLVKNAGFSVSKEQILYNCDIFAQSSDASLAVIVNRLRKKLPSNILIKSIRGIGYKLLT